MKRLAWLFAVVALGCAQAESLDDVSSGGSSGSSGSSGSGGGGGGGSSGTGNLDDGGGDAPVDGDLPGDAPPDAPVDGPGPDAANPCDGVQCRTPPAATCLDANTLRTYDGTGTCVASGHCVYPTSNLPCPGGCSGGACDDNPCLGVSCNSPPPPRCADEDHRTVYSPQGVCGDQGQCSYQSTNAFCPFGCVNDVCVGDPCIGVSCTAPPASYCRDASTLVVTDSPGTCAGAGDCTYPAPRDVFCAFGCDQGGCRNDPCAGRTCNTPPARSCKDASTALTYASSGTCAAGICSYAPTEVPCPFGCVNGLCRDCQVSADCGAGRWCNGGACAACDNSSHCGATCADCAAGGQVCNAGACVECVGEGTCGSGRYCSGNQCVACNTNARCGAACTACATGTRCDGGGCVPCNTQATCGPSCGPCGGGTPYCLDQGANSRCVQCRSSSDCGGTDVCTNGTCGPPCPATLTSVFSETFDAPGTPNATGWTSGADTQIGSTRWRSYTQGQSGVRVSGNRFEVTSKRSSSTGHGQGYGYVRTGGTGSAYDSSLYLPTLKQNTGKELVWSFNMRRHNPSDSTNGGFKCSSTSSQNGNTVGLAYVLATDSAAGLNASASTCSANATSSGYAVVLGDENNRGLRLVRFSQGLRSGNLTNLVSSGNFTVTNFFSVRVTYNAVNDQWRLEVRNDGTSSFTAPTGGGAYNFSGVATDATYVNTPLEYSGPYFQSGCIGNCEGAYTALFDNVNVGVRCAP